MKISLITLFPDMLKGPLEHSIVKRAQESGHIEINYVLLREFGLGKHQVVDDRPYGGGVGMVLKVDVVEKAIQATRIPSLSTEEEQVVLLSAHGETFSQSIAKELSTINHLILICGHYEGFDERIKLFIDREISVGDFIVTGGEIPALLITDAVVRLVPGVLKPDATANESFSTSLLEYPQYTTPQEYKGHIVPEILLSGNHQKIQDWKNEQSEKTTRKLRPDLLTKKHAHR